MLEVNEQDWKKFRKKLPEWQENCMNRLNQKYAATLSGAGLASEKFWKLEEMIKKDKHLTGVLADVRRSRMHEQIAKLILEGTIQLSDLDEFSEDLREQIATMVSYHKTEQDSE